jgi:hypothetical protein
MGLANIMIKLIIDARYMLVDLRVVRMALLVPGWLVLVVAKVTNSKRNGGMNDGTKDCRNINGCNCFYTFC